jgi:hypothetical protein
MARQPRLALFSDGRNCGHNRSGVRQITLRRALLAQGICLLAPVGATAFNYYDAVAHPAVCYGWCLPTLGPVLWLMGTLPLVPAAVLVFVLAWRWRGPSVWPAFLLAAVNLAVLLVGAGLLSTYVTETGDPNPASGLLGLLLVLPPVATTVLAVNRLRPIPWRPGLVAGAVGSGVLAILLTVNVIGPPHQEIPGELSLPFSKTVVYEGHDLGCRTRVSGWVKQHECTNASLVVYWGSGDPSADQLIIGRAVQDPTRFPPNNGKVEPLPVDAPFGQSYTGKIDYRERGGCVLIIDRNSPPPAVLTYGHCGSVQDYADIRAHWPGDVPYAIGVVYWYIRPG